MVKKITLAQGAGGQLMDQLIKQTILKSFKKQGTAEVSLAALDDAAVSFFPLILIPSSH
jgi:hydrogenase maturation factor